MRKEKTNLGTLVEWNKIEGLSSKACWDLKNTIAVFIRDYLYKFIEENTHAYPIGYESVDEWHDRLKAIAENLSIGSADTPEFDISVLENPDLTHEQKTEAFKKFYGAKQECIRLAFKELGEVFFDLWD